mgnify:CR=1 FL=1|tara:strand:+ start:3270 stop:3905 length:636 start_codon:yes stop_codon:yes gene_type:complete
MQKKQSQTSKIPKDLSYKTKKREFFGLELPKDLKNEVEQFCKLNEIEDCDTFLLGCLRGGFAIEKFGRTPVSAGKEIIEKEVIKEVEREVEKIVEVPVEKIVEKIIEVQVEKIIEVEKTITDNSKIEEYSHQANELKIENERLNQTITILNTTVENLETHSEDSSSMKKQMVELKNKIKEYEEVLEHFRRFSSPTTTHLKSSRLDDEYYNE